MKKRRGAKDVSMLLFIIQKNLPQARKEHDVNTAMSIFDKYMGVKPTIVNAHRIYKQEKRPWT